MVTPVSMAEPIFWTEIVYVKTWPGMSGQVALEDLLIAREPIFVTSVAVLLGGTGSVVVVATPARLVSVPLSAVSVVTTRVIVTVLLETIVPRLQLTTLVPLQAPCVVADETSVTLKGKVSLTTTLVAYDGPLLKTVSV